MSAEILPAALLKRKAVVYVRQSTQTQVQTNLESRRRQYNLVELARRHGAALIRINPRESEGPGGTVSLPLGALDALTRIDALVAGEDDHELLSA